ncbi:amidohydrolase family protein [Rathayibacter sp. CAU 1779]
MRTDAHVHVWTDALADTGRRTGARAVEPRDTLDRLRPLAAEAGVDRVVLVQTIGSETESEELLALAGSDPLVAGVVGWVDLAAPDVEGRLDRMLGSAGGERLVGIRSMVPRIATRQLAIPHPGDARRADDRAASPLADGMRALAARDLTLDLLLTPERLPDALALVEAVPDLRFVIDHLAKPDVARNDLESWRAHLKAFARHGSVAVKLSGLLTQLDSDRQGIDDLRPYVDAVLEDFGPDRVMIGSDWPLCEPVGGYVGAIGTIDGLVADWAGTGPTSTDRQDGRGSVSAERPNSVEGAASDRSVVVADRTRGGTAADWYRLGG